MKLQSYRFMMATMLKSHVTLKNTWSFLSSLSYFYLIDISLTSWGSCCILRLLYLLRIYPKTLHLRRQHDFLPFTTLIWNSFHANDALKCCLFRELTGDWNSASLSLFIFALVPQLRREMQFDICSCKQSLIEGFECIISFSRPVFTAAHMTFIYRDRKQKTFRSPKTQRKSLQNHYHQ